jgi:hypothetical protein
MKWQYIDNHTMRAGKCVEQEDGTLIGQEDGVEALLGIYAHYHWTTTHPWQP